MPTMSEPWDPAAPGILRLPSGRLVRGRGLRRPLPAGDCEGPERLPEFGLYLLGSDPPEVPWESHWLDWPDFGLPADCAQAAKVLAEVWRRSDRERVEIACAGGGGRPGTALAGLRGVDGVRASEAVGFVRANYDPHAVETPWQRRFVARFKPSA